MRVSGGSGSASSAVALVFALPFCGSPLQNTLHDADNPVEGFPQRHQQQQRAVYSHTTLRGLTSEQQG